MALEAFALILLMIVIGKICARARLLPTDTAEVLNRVVIAVCLPAAVLRYAPQLAFDRALIGLALVPWALLAASVGLVVMMSRALRLRPAQHAVLLLCVPLGNTSFLGYPLIEAFLGRDALPYAVVYDQFGSFLIVSSFGLWVLARYGGDAKPSGREIALRVLRFPPFLALVVALTLMPAQPPEPVARVLERLSEAMLPLVTLAIGLQLRLRVPREERAALAAGLALKLLVLPALAWPLCLALGLPPLATQVAVLESAMPTMITVAALAISHRLAPSLAAALVGFGIPLSLLTLFGWRWLLAG